MFATIMASALQIPIPSHVPFADTFGPGVDCSSADGLKGVIYPILAKLKGDGYLLIVVSFFLALIAYPVVHHTRHKGTALSVFGVAIAVAFGLGFGLQFLNSIVPLPCVS